MLIVGGYGYRNAGDEAVLAGLIELIGRDRRMLAVSRNPVETAATHGIPSIGIAGVAGALRRHRSVAIGGGGLFGDGMGRLGRLIAPFGLAAAATGRTVAIVGVGVDAGLPVATSAALRLLAPRLAGLTVRDAASATVLAALGIRADVGADLSAAMPDAAHGEGLSALAAAGLDPTRPIVGLCLTSIGGPGLQASIEAVATGLVDALPDLQLCFIPMSRHPYLAEHSDLVLAGRLRRAAPRMAVLDGDLHPAQLQAVFGSLSAAVCMRYHSLWFAERAGIPIVAVPYAAKSRSWLAERNIDPVPPHVPALVEAVRRAVGSGPS